jgi:hypothetical protein
MAHLTFLNILNLSKYNIQLVTIQLWHFPILIQSIPETKSTNPRDWITKYPQRLILHSHMIPITIPIIIFGEVFFPIRNGMVYFLGLMKFRALTPTLRALNPTAFR